MAEHRPDGNGSRGARLVGFGWVGLISVLVISVFVISQRTDRPYLEYLQVVILTFLVVTMLRKFVLWVRHVRGRVLMDLGPHPMYAPLRLTSVLILFALFCFYMAKVTSPESDGSSILGFAGMVVLGIFALTTALERFQLVEGGFWCFGILKPWKEIAEYSWTPDSKVVLRMRGRSDRFKGHAVPVPHGDRDAVEAVLRSHGIPGRID